ncbi:hypothetical protein BC628DRAFT_1419832 [Trametes gibbosa]|nr:hypothetical protein BC628DRAFT_1419832 [Trametes gibbosa]
MDDAPDPENDTVRVPIAPPTAGTPSGLATAGGVGTESVTAFGDEYGPDDYRVRSQRLRISPSDDWHAVTQIAADAIHDIRMLFRDVRGELLASIDSPNMLQATYNPIANELDSLGAELDELFVQSLGMEPRHYQWKLAFLEGIGNRPRIPRATSGSTAGMAQPTDVEMAGPVSAGAAAPVRVPTPAPLPPEPGDTTANDATNNVNKRRDKGKGKARADREPTPPPTAAQPMRKRPRANTMPLREEYIPTPAPQLPNPRTVELLMQRYPHASLEDILNLSDAYASSSAAHTTYERPPTPSTAPPSSPSTYAAIAARFTSPVPSISSRGLSRPVSQASSRAEAETQRPRGKRRRVRGPPGASRRLYARFANPPPAEMRAGALTVVGAVNAALANQANEHLRVRATSADWTASGQLFIQFAGVLPDGLVPVIRDIVIQHGWGGPANGPDAVTVERYAITSQLCFRGVPCVDGQGNPLDAQTVAQAAFEHSPEWQEVLPARRINFMPPRDGASTTTLVVEITDTSSRARQRALAGTSLPFPDGVRTAQILEDRRQIPQCSQCLRWGHVRGVCRANSTTCEHCGEAHDIRHHRALAGCCRGSAAPACTHAPRCVNCGQAHRATARECPYYVHRNDFAWHQARAPTARARGRSQNEGDNARNTRAGQSSQQQPRASGSGNSRQGGREKRNTGHRDDEPGPSNRGWGWGA